MKRNIPLRSGFPKFRRGARCISAVSLLVLAGCSSAAEQRCEERAQCAEGFEQLETLQDVEECVADAEAVDAFKASADVGCDSLYLANDAFIDCNDANSSCDEESGIVRPEEGSCEAEFSAFIEAAGAVDEGVECFPTGG